MSFGDWIFELRNELSNKSYRHGDYEAFKIKDPKPRDIHKASVRDRLVHHALYRVLYPYFDTKFIFDSYSCRVNKGTHRALNRFRTFHLMVSKNNTRTCWVLKCDVRKFFASIDHNKLKQVLESHIADRDVLNLLKEVVASFGTGLPLGNLTSQLLVNIYMNSFDHFVKRELKVKYYIRYADDFVLLSDDREYLLGLISKISEFLNNKLKLELHPNKVSIKTFSSGIDFLGWVHFPHHRALRTSTKNRMFRKLEREFCELSVSSYLGLLSHGDTYALSASVKDFIRKLKI